MTIPFKGEASDEASTYEDSWFSGEDAQVYVSEEELMARQLESRIKSLREEISVMERDIEQIPNSQLATDIYASKKESFTRFEKGVRDECAKCAKAKSLTSSSSTEDLERAIFATRVRFLNELLQGCEKYRSLLLQILNSPASESFRPKRRTLSDKGKLILGKWFEEHRANPFPTTAEKESLSRQVGAPVEQISTWFINARARKGKPNHSSSSSTMKRHRTDADMTID
jgi:hypothetical protein